MSKVTLGGERLGSGNKQKVELRNYERSTHDLSYIWRSTMASGTLVPFMSEVALPGDTFDIDLECDIKTHPTIGPLFGSYKVQLDVFQCPVRLYNGKLHMNMLNIGMNMAEIKLPQVRLKSYTETGDNKQINTSSIFSYLGIQGLGRKASNEQTEIQRDFNAIPWLSYWDIYKNYYANKQEEVGAVIHNNQNIVDNTINKCYLYSSDGYEPQQLTDQPQNIGQLLGVNGYCEFHFDNNNEPDLNTIYLELYQDDVNTEFRQVMEIFEYSEWDSTENKLILTKPRIPYQGYRYWIEYVFNGTTIEPNQQIPRVTLFDLSEIDKMRVEILTQTSSSAPFIIDANTGIRPYQLALKKGDTGKYSIVSSQEGLGLKTYQSDLFNNWISTEWIDGDNGINSITAIDTSEGSFTIDTLQLSRKIYDMLNRISVSGGTYDDWLDAVYTHERTRSVENPIYHGGLIKELAFQEVVSNAQSETTSGEQPLGTLAGRGVLTKKHKGGKVVVRVDEPSFLIGIISLTPRIDYSQGNNWAANLKTMDDFHKPALDEIGFQDLITDQMAYWETKTDDAGNVIYNSAGKQPAWINYMTNVNKCYGNFAVQNEQMFMTLNRRYEKGSNGIKDLTTYIDPSKFNNIFADTRLDAQNFWAQIAVNIEARRKMSAKIMPNL